jgi:hypothetical protein
MGVKLFFLTSELVQKLGDYTFVVSSKFLQYT